MDNTYHPARLAYIAQRLAPYRAATKIVDLGPSVAVTLECGHTINCVNHFYYRVSGEHRCRECGKEIALKLPEFVGKKAEVPTN